MFTRYIYIALLVREQKCQRMTFNLQKKRFGREFEFYFLRTQFLFRKFGRENVVVIEMLKTVCLQSRKLWKNMKFLSVG